MSRKLLDGLGPAHYTGDKGDDILGEDEQGISMRGR
jgi:hypothetical protein